MPIEEYDSKRLRPILDGIGHAVVAADRQSRIVAANAGAERLRHRKAEQMIGQPLAQHFVLLDAETHRPIRMPSFASFRKSAAPRRYARAFLAIEEGAPDVVVDATLGPLRDGRGHMNGLMLMLTDISENVIRERGAADRQRVEAIRAMAANMARDFNNWLSVISGHATSIIEGVSAHTRAHTAAIRILEATKHASGLMKRLLTVAKAGRPDSAADLAAVQPEAVLQETVNLARATFLGDRVSIRVKHGEDVPYVLANGIQLLSCLMNLIRNAKEAMPRGGTITLDVAEHTVGRKAYVVIGVRDTGTGMNRETLERIFTPFFSTKEPGIGTGLGLTVVRTLVESWGGFVRVRTRVNRGTTFHLFLPRTEKPSEAAVPRVKRAMRETILVADDKPDVLKEARRMLEMAGHKVLTATNGRDCVALHRRHSDEISLVILDAIMPGDNPRDILDQILASDATVPIVMMSGFSRDYLRGHFERGTWGFLQKPFDQQQLLASVQRALDQRRRENTKDQNGTP